MTVVTSRVERDRGQSLSEVDAELVDDGYTVSIDVVRRHHEPNPLVIAVRMGKFERADPVW